MKIAIVGAGAMGSLFGALLTEVQNEVWLYDVWAEHVHAINDSGLSIERLGKTRRVRINATTNPENIGHAELVIVFVKSTQTRSASEPAAELAAQDGSVMTLQNGMGNADIISEWVDPARILAGTTSHGATMIGPGKIRHAGAGATIIGSWSKSKQEFMRARYFSEFFTQAGIQTDAVEDVHKVVWNKLLINVGINAITALTGITNGQVLDLKVTREMSRSAVEEAMSVACALGIDVNPDAVDQVFKVAKATDVNRSSMGQDADNQRQTEISAINGYIVREADKLGLNVPVNRTLTALVETLQFHYKKGVRCQE
jgi:2-dehydropantoate 2-reductase